MGMLTPRPPRVTRGQVSSPNDIYIDVSFSLFVIYLRSNVNIKKWETPLGTMFLDQEEEVETSRTQFGLILGHLSRIRSSAKIRVSKNPKIAIV